MTGRCAADGCHEPATERVTATVGDRGTVTLLTCPDHRDTVRDRIAADHLDGQLDLFRRPG